ncbi:WhiB family transcriptional regulator [Mycolicibacterium goodii]|uniref:WhiB family transcriptional regulator n=1 Tax=Mycolicibacterium goodii TaxID=134601 RepID=UPI001BDBFD63|nr:WhiB family transcriptional regulator [Mycolicibacterium goodii]MBU8841521.1 WhiB family transcriptional regulator [Mycolicibacterium goodii]
MTHLVANPVKIEVNGLCNYSADPEDWFDYRKADQCKRICGNCPLRQACARTALALGATDGVWAGVDLPGEHATVDEHKVARRQLAMVVAAMDHQPESHRRRCLAIREAMHNAAFPGTGAYVAESASA